MYIKLFYQQKSPSKLTMIKSQIKKRWYPEMNKFTEIKLFILFDKMRRNQVQIVELQSDVIAEFYAFWILKKL